MTGTTIPIDRRDIVTRKDDAAPKRPLGRGIVVAKFTITETTMSGIGYTPAEPGEYAVVTWHNRMKLRVESIEDLVKVGYVESR